MLKTITLIIACCFFLVFFCAVMAIFLSPEPAVTAQSLAMYFFDRLIEVAL